MKTVNIEVFPKVFCAEKTQKVYVRYNAETAKELYVKIQPMEIYGLEHTKNYRVDEEERYSYERMEIGEDGRYFTEFHFFGEQKYDVKIKLGEEILYHTHIYSVNADMVGVNVFKGDTHLHTNRSDGEGTPFEVGCAYRAAGYDFIAVTDHHLYAPSVEAQETFDNLTSYFTVFKGEEVHNAGMGYVHIINFDGDFSVNKLVETQGEYVQQEVERIQKSTHFDGVADTYDCAYRMFIAEQIRKGGGLAIMAHPYWDVYGEYHMPTSTVEYLLKNNVFDALEVVAACDIEGNNGSNLQVALWSDLRAQGVKIPVLGASDSHSYTLPDSLFDKQYSLVFAKEKSDIKQAIKNECSVAVLAQDKQNYFVYGPYRFVKYARFLLDEYFPEYIVLAKKHALALARQSKATILQAEMEIDAYKESFFNW